MCTTFFFSVGFREGIKDQQLVAIAVQNMVKTHEGASDSLFEAKTRLTHLQEKKAAMEGDSAKEDKVAALDAQILEAETNVMKVGWSFVSTNARFGPYFL